MVYRVKTYTLREEAAENGTRYFISFKDGQGGCHELEVSEQFFIEFRRMERKNRNLLQSDERHKGFFELSDEALNRRARVTPKGVDELIIEHREHIKERPHIRRYKSVTKSLWTEIFFHLRPYFFFCDRNGFTHRRIL